MSKDIQTHNSRNLIAAVINAAVMDALGIFRIPDPHSNVGDFEAQYKALLCKYQGRIFNRRSDLFSSRENFTECTRARVFLEKSYFDDLAGLIGYDSLFVNKTFSMVQEAITLEKKLFQELSK